MNCLLLLLLGRTFLIFLLVMEVMPSSSSSLPPKIAYLEVIEAGLSHQLLTNRTFMYSPTSFEQFEILCKSEERSDSVRYKTFKI